MCEDSQLADTGRCRSSLGKVGCQWKAYSSELLWVAVKRLTENDLNMPAPSQSGAVQLMTNNSMVAL